jgi:hypothetical protein
MKTKTENLAPAAVALWALWPISADMARGDTAGAMFWTVAALIVAGLVSGE